MRSPDRSVRLAGAAAALRRAVAAVPFPWERERLDRCLAPPTDYWWQTHIECWTHGQTMPLEQAVALAFAEGEPEFVPTAGLVNSPSDLLSARERDVAQLVTRGYSNRQIAEELVIAPRTADTHVGNILSKLDLHTRAELAVWAVEHGLTADRPRP